MILPIASPYMQSRYLMLSVLLAASNLFAAEITEILPVREDQIMVHVVDGTISYAKIGELKSADKLTVRPVKTENLSAAAFAITSANDPAYAGGKTPLTLGRKSKGKEYAEVQDPWVGGYGFKPAAPYAVMEHWIYLTLPSKLVEGGSYSLSYDSERLGVEPSSASISFSSLLSRTEALHVNLVGYVPEAPAKFGYLYHWAGSLGGIDYSSFEGKPFHLVNIADGAIAFTGSIAFRKNALNVETGQSNNTPNSNFLGASVWECDFSSFKTHGTYRLSVPGLGCSFPFQIGRDVYRAAFHATMKGLYQNRSGIALTAPFADENRPAPHHPKLTPGFENRLNYTTTRFMDCATDGGSNADKAKIEAGAKGKLKDTWGWYQDAGDWDGYFNHINIPNTLLLLYQLHPDKFTDGELTIPESGNGIPDLVDEGMWLPRFFARLRSELKAKGWGTGGVGSRAFGDYWGEDTPNNTLRGSWQDTDREWYVTGEDVFSTYRYASTAAQIAEILTNLGKADPEGIDWKKEAQEAYDWAYAHQTPSDESHSEQLSLLKEHRALAAISLYRISGDELLHTRFKTDIAGVTLTTQLNDVQTLATVMYLSHPQPLKLDGPTRDRLAASLTSTSLFYTDYSASQRACRFGGNFWFPTVIGQGSTPLLQTAVLGETILQENDATTAQKIKSVIYTTSDYFLGTNPHNMTWVTGLGPRFPTGIFHYDDWVSGPATRTGVVTYGPATFAQAWIPLRMNPSPWWAWDTTYPSIDPRGPGKDAATALAPGTWPAHECFFNQRGSPQISEFTIWQTILPSALTYGSLVDSTNSTPVIVAAPVSTETNEGSIVSLSVTCDPVQGLSYQWYKDGQPVAGATASSLLLRAAQLYDIGSYTVKVTHGSASITSSPATVSIVPAGSHAARLVNISTRGFSKAGNGVMIAGFFIAGSGSQSVLARVVGPGLTHFGVARVVTNPLLQLIHMRGAELGNETLATNTHWTLSGTELILEKSSEVGAFALNVADNDTAVVAALSPGSYTVIAGSHDGQEGNALIEIYDSGGSTAAELMNISTRGFCGTGDDVIIAGFALRTASVGQLLIRGMGPSMAAFGVPDLLENPVIALFDSSGQLIAQNDDWKDAGNFDQIPQAGNSVGAFSAAPNDRESVLLVSLPNGTYTVVVRGVDNTIGNTLIEVYRVDAS